jgi:hypothetical protein
MGYRALIYSDLQATDGHERLFAKPDVPLQVHRVRKFYRWLRQLFVRHKCDCLWDLGDTTDDRSFLPMPAIDAVMEGLEPFPVHELNLKLIGNHEQYLRDTSLHIGRMFASRFSIVAQTEAFEVEGTLIACAAYPACHAALADWLAQTARTYRNYARRLLLGHFQVAGALMTGGPSPLGVPGPVLDEFTLALLGHIHKPQEIGKRGHYIGSPFQQNYGERDEEKRVAVLDTQTLELEWIPVEGFPRYHVVGYEDWCNLVRQGHEDRYQVILADNAQALAYYRHPLMGQAEPIYDFKMTPEPGRTPSRSAWTSQDMLERWLRERPPSSQGIETSLAEVRALGQFLLRDGVEKA